MTDPSLTPWLASFTAALAFDPWEGAGARKGGDESLLAVLTAALARLLPEGDDPAAHVRAEVRSEPGRLAFSLEGLTPSGRAAVDALAEGREGDGGYGEAGG